METWTKKIELSRISTFLVELHLDDVLMVLLLVGADIYQNKLKERYQRKIKKKKDNMILNFYFDLPYRTTPGQCSRGSPGGWSWISFLQNLYINIKGKFIEKKCDDWFMNGGDIKLFNLSRKKK